MTPAILAARDVDESDRTHRVPRRDLLEEHYRAIGETLSICEAAVLCAGIPWLFPTASVHARALKYQGPVEQFIRLSLVNISTSTLELYCDDLENAPVQSTERDPLYLAPLSNLDRFCWCLAIIACGACLVYLICQSLGLSPLFTALGIVGTGSILFAACAPYCLESHRRYSLHSLLYAEILRRKGLDHPNTKGVRILPVETKPTP
ncbi:MAG TPA: hypothetical protein PLP17_05915 [Oligoflexia bacterium]|nr:hypothetical protein [Oligoflexia bacterium]